MANANVMDSKNYTSLWQDSTLNIAWGTVCLFLGIIAGYILVISSALSGSLPYPVATLICSYLSFASFTVAHDAGHGSIFKMGSSLKPMEDVMGWIASVPLLLVPYRFFQKIHDRHHAFTNDPVRDPDHFVLGDAWYSVLLNVFYIPFQYHIMSVTSLRHIKTFRDTYFSTVVYMVLVYSALITLSQLGYTREVIYFVITPLIISLFMLIMFFDYLPHHPHKSQGRYHNSRIYPSKLLNALLLGQNYHLIHHMYPRLPWYKYEEVFYKILPDLEEQGAPIEDIGSGLRPGFMTSPNARNLQHGGKSINMLLKVGGIERLTEDSVSVSFELPEGEKLRYQAGQYLTVSKWLAGEQQTRCYSFCSSPASGELKIGVRQTQDGLVSKYINNTLKQGDELIVQGPFGDFFYPPKQSKNIDELVLIAGGSGITPMLSILETALQENDGKSVHLIYACRSRKSIMFFDHIELLQSESPTRLKVTYVINENQTDSVGVSGRLDRTLLKSILAEDDEGEDHSKLSATEFYICGPEGLKNMAVETLEANAILSTRIHIEQFVSSLVQPIGILHEVSIALADGQQHMLKVASNQTVLEVAKAEKVMLPHACESGTCGTCKFQVDKGRVDEIPNSIPGLTTDERAAGFTLACQCKPLSNLSMLEVRN